MAYGGTYQGIVGGAGLLNLATTLYTGNSTARSLVTGQNLAGGGLVWSKKRSGVYSHYLFDTERGAGQTLQSDTIAAESNAGTSLTAFNSNGFSLGAGGDTNNSGDTYVAWSFLQKAGFMDIVHWYGSAGSRNINHNLGTTVGFIIARRIDVTSEWYCYHKDIINAGDNPIYLNSTSPPFDLNTVWNDTLPTTTRFTVNSALNNPGEYIAYLFAHNPAQKIYCGSFTTDGSGNATVTGLGFRPKWVLWKRSSATGPWDIPDTKRGWADGSNDRLISANSSNGEGAANQDYGGPTGDGMTIKNLGLSSTYIFMAIG